MSVWFKLHRCLNTLLGVNRVLRCTELSSVKRKLATRQRVPACNETHYHLLSRASYEVVIHMLPFNYLIKVHMLINIS